MQSFAIHLETDISACPQLDAENVTKLADHFVSVGFISHRLAFTYLPMCLSSCSFLRTRPRQNFIINVMDERTVLWKEAVTKVPVAQILAQG